MNPDQDRDRDVYSHALCDADSHSELHTDRDSHYHADRDRHGDADDHTHADSNTDLGSAYPDIHPHQDSHSPDPDSGSRQNC